MGKSSAEFVSTHFLVVHNDARRSAVKHQPIVQIVVSNFSDSLTIFSIIQHFDQVSVVIRHRAGAGEKRNLVSERSCCFYLGCCGHTGPGHLPAAYP